MNQDIDKIVCLIGESGSGKTTLAMRLEREGYNVIKSYTTRLPRGIDEWGHIFVSEEEYLKQDFTQVVAQTCFDENRYWALREQFEGKGMSVYILDPIGERMIRNEVDNTRLTTIYLKVDEGKRIERMRKDGRSEKEIAKRVEHDRLRFKLINCDYVIDNNGDLEEAVNLMKLVIKGV
jgi:guanylate kinase